MSSEQRAERVLDEAIANKAMHWHSATPEETYQLNAAVAIARDEYKTAIEQRVLAQQPCYRTWLDDGAMCIAELPSYVRADYGPYRCPTCVARQTQETSG